MIAGTLELDFVTNLARLQGELTAIKRAVGETMGEAVSQHNQLVKSSDALVRQLEREAQTFNMTSAQIREMDVAAKALALEERGLIEQADRLRAAQASLNVVHLQSAGAMKQVGQTSGAMRTSLAQIPDVLAGIAGGQKPLTILAQQGLQVLQVAQMAQGGIRGFAGEVAALALRFAPLLAVVGIATSALALFAHEMSDDAGLKAYADGLGLTKKEMEKLGPVSVTMGDVVKGTWRTLVQVLDLSGPIEGAKKLLSQAIAGAVTIFKDTAAGIYALFVGGYRSIEATWRMWPAVLGDIFVQAVNGAAATIEFLLNKSIGAVNSLAAGANKLTGLDLFGQLDSVRISRMNNQWAGAAGQAGKAAAQAFSGAYSEGLQGIDTIAGKLFENINAVARERVKKLADDIIADRAVKSAKAAADEAAQRAKNLLDLEHDLGAQREAIAKWVQSAPTLKIDVDKSGIKDWLDGLKAAEEYAARLNFDRATESAERLRIAASGISDAWGHVGRSIGDAMGVLADYVDKQADLDRQTKAGNLDGAAYAKKSADLQLNSLIGITDAAKNLFSTHSKGYKAMEAAEKALTIIQLARTAVDVAGGAARMFASLGPLAFPAVGAMLAVMASLGFASGGSGGQAPATNQGGGTSLGDTSKASASIKNSIDMLGDIDTVIMTHSAEMATSLKSIDAHIGNLASLLVRTGNIDGAAAGIQTGFNSSLSGSLIMGAVAGPIGALLNGVITKIPVIGDIIGGIQGVIKSLFGTKTSVVGSGLYGGAQSLADILSGGFDLDTYADVKKTKKFLGVSTGSKYSTQYGSADAEVAAQFGLILQSFNDAITAAAGPLGLATDDITQRLSSFVVDIGKIDLKGLSGDEISERLSAVFGAAADNMAQAAVPGLDKFQKVGEGYFETLVRVASTMEVVTSGLDMLGKSTAGLGIDAKMGLAGMFDSVDDLQSATNAYFTTFYTDAEQAAAKTAQLAGVFSSLGIAMPSNIASFRALVDAQDLTTAAGQSTYATLLKLAPAFAEIATGAQSATNAAAIVRERQDLEARLLELQGDVAAQRAAELAKLDPSNRALQQRIYALTDEQAAIEAATQAAQAAAAAERAIADERAGLERQLLQLQGDSTALRALDLAKLDDSNRALQLHIWALEDEAAATQAAAQAASDAAAKQAAIASERAGLEKTLLGLQGDTTALRALELAALDPANRALQEQIYALQDQQAAAALAEQAQARAAEAAQQAAEEANKLRDAWASVADGIMDEVNRIRGLNGTSGMSFAALLGQFNAATTAARAGDQTAAGQLPKLSQALLDAAAAQATSQQELNRIQAQTAASLEATYNRINAATTAAGLPAGSSANDTAARAWFNRYAPANDTRASDELKAEVAAMRSDMRLALATIAANTRKTAKVLDDVSSGEQTINTVSAA